MSTPYGENNYGHNPFDPPASNQNQQPWAQNPQQFQQPNQMANFNQPVQPVAQKSKIVAALLAFFLGQFGLHNYYLGYNNRGTQMLITWIVAFVTSFIVIGLFVYIVLGIWVFIDFILILLGAGRFSTDANGVPLS